MSLVGRAGSPKHEQRAVYAPLRGLIHYIGDSDSNARVKIEGNRKFHVRNVCKCVCNRCVMGRVGVREVCPRIN
jgi:hypothetical protein